MKFGTWRSKWQAVGRNLRRFWPAVVVMSIWLLLSVWPDTADMFAFKTQSSDWDSLPSEYEKYYMLIAGTAGLRMTIYGCVCALLLMRDNFKGRYARGIDSFPQTRENRFLGMVLSGFVLFLIPLAVSMVLFLPLLEISWLLLLGYILTVLLFWLVGFAVGMLAATLTGTVFAAILSSLILTFGLPLLERLAAIIVEFNMAGVVWPSSNTLMLSPLLMLISGVLRERGRIQAVLVLFGKGWGAVVASGVVSLLMLLLAFFLYRKRATERAGDFLAFPRLKPVMKLLCTCVGGGLLGLILMEILCMSETIYHPAQTMIWLLPGVLIARLVSEMVVEKTTRVFRKKQLLSYGLCALVVVGLVYLMHLDPFGVETRLPKQENVVSVEVKSVGETATFTSPENIASVLELHDEVLSYRGYPDADGGMLYNDVDVSFTYSLKSGRTIERYYSLSLDVSLEDFTNGWKDHDLLRKLDGFVNSPQWLLAQLQTEAGTTEASAVQVLPRITEARIVRVMPNLTLGTVSDQKVVEELLYAAIQDLEDGKAWLAYSYHDRKDLIYYRVDFSFYEEGDTVVVDRSGRLSRQVSVYFSAEDSGVAALMEMLAEQYGWPDPYDLNILGR